jgi:hypothetical protein
MRRKFILPVFFTIIACITVVAGSIFADTISITDTIHYGDSLVIEKTVSISDTVNISPNTVEMATGMRSNGKIYVVILVLCLVLAGILIFLLTIDHRLKKLEKDTN